MECKILKEQMVIESVEEAISDELLKMILGTKTYDKLIKHREFDLEDLRYISEDEVGYLTDMEKDKVFAFKEILKRGLPVTEKIPICSPKDCYSYFKNMNNLEQVNLVLATLNTKNMIVSEKTIFVGSLNATVIHQREIFKEAVKKSANSIILALNHPSGVTVPSKEETCVVSKIKEAGEMMGIELLDCIIIGNNKFYSFKEGRTTIM